jgi:hypothetical protein
MILVFSSIGKERRWGQQTRDGDIEAPPADLAVPRETRPQTGASRETVIIDQGIFNLIIG